MELAAWRVPSAWLDRVRRAASAAGAPRLASLGLVETLTDREREVLRLLPSRLTLSEIADELFISMNTLKFHLKVIYRKLGCSSRAEAAAISQGMARPGSLDSEVGDLASLRVELGRGHESLLHQLGYLPKLCPRIDSQCGAPGVDAVC